MSASSDAGMHENATGQVTKGRRRPKQDNAGPSGVNAIPGNAVLDETRLTQLNTALEACASLPAVLQAQTDALTNMSKLLQESLQGTGDDNSETSDIESGHEHCADDDDPAKDILSELNIDLDRNDQEGHQDSDYLSAILDLTQGAQDFGKPLQEKIAKSFSRIPGQLVAETVIERLKYDYKVPENCKLLSVPKVNAPMWAKMEKIHRSADARLQHLQQQISRSIVANARAAENLFLNASKIPNDVLEATMRLVIDSSTALGIAFRELNSRRKAAIKSCLRDDAAGICDTKTVPGEWLFGENVEQDVRVVKAVGKIMKPKRGFRSRPYTRGVFQRNNNNRNFKPNNLNWQGPAHAVRKNLPGRSMFRGQASKQQISETSQTNQ
ncbi:unnamed protein product [Allacma fusca]|uniref:Uncharacterized protein n=1 Tax=Allacma fusca TaxID=39272 RepID=A0A8J2K684_9HEXA|nr:unnamed protein product [Allacma fusca]